MRKKAERESSTRLGARFFDKLGMMREEDGSLRARRRSRMPGRVRNDNGREIVMVDKRVGERSFNTFGTVRDGSAEPAGGLLFVP